MTDEENDRPAWGKRDPLEVEAMKIRAGMEADYAEYKEINSHDPYGARIVSYSEDWANLMEAQFADGKTIEQCAKETSRAADTDGITGFMYGASVSGLSKFWIHGEALRLWHNLKTQIGHEGERANKSGGVLNPALLSIGESGAEIETDD